MSQLQALKNAIETFQPGGVDTPILYSTTEYNEKGFKALLGRRLNGRRSIAVGILIFAIVIIAASAIIVILAGQTGTPVFVTYFPVFIAIYLHRTTLITVGDAGIEFYFIDSKLGSKYIAYDKFILPYDKITDVKVRTGKFNTSFAFEFSSDEKKYKIKTSVPNKMKKMEEQGENLKDMLETLEKKRLNSKSGYARNPRV